MQSTDELLIGVAEASEVLGVSKTTVTRWAKSGRLPVIRKLRGETGGWLFDAGVIRRVAQERLLRKVG